MHFDTVSTFTWFFFRPGYNTKLTSLSRNKRLLAVLKSTLFSSFCKSRVPLKLTVIDYM